MVDITYLRRNKFRFLQLQCLNWQIRFLVCFGERNICSGTGKVKHTLIRSEMFEFLVHSLQTIVVCMDYCIHPTLELSVFLCITTTEYFFMGR